MYKRVAEHEQVCQDCLPPIARNNVPLLGGKSVMPANFRGWERFGCHRAIEEMAFGPVRRPPLPTSGHDFPNISFDSELNGGGGVVPGAGVDWRVASCDNDTENCPRSRK